MIFQLKGILYLQWYWIHIFRFSHMLLFVLQYHCITFTTRLSNEVYEVSSSKNNSGISRNSADNFLFWAIDQKRFKRTLPFILNSVSTAWTAVKVRIFWNQQEKDSKPCFDQCCASVISTLIFYRRCLWTRGYKKIYPYKKCKPYREERNSSK